MRAKRKKWIEPLSLFNLTLFCDLVRITYPSRKLFITSKEPWTAYAVLGFSFTIVYQNAFWTRCKMKNPNLKSRGSFSDLVRIQTLNLQSRNLVLYSVELRGQSWRKDIYFISKTKFKQTFKSKIILKVDFSTYKFKLFSCFQTFAKTKGIIINNSHRKES